ncbi:hypothetical protein JW823_00425 [bacterium]|nr:hypothetical protein [candidate division CSSED10-310 bacterium]
MAEIFSFTINGMNVICTEDAVESLRDIYRSGLWVYEWMQKQPGTFLLRGRRPVRVGDLAGATCVVKRHSHGGSLARITGDRFFSANRVLNAMKSAEYLQTKRILTPRYRFIAWRKSGLWTRCESGVIYLNGGEDAAVFLFRDICNKLDARIERVAEGIGALVRRLHSIEFLHNDLNLMNFLILESDVIAILDLDKSTPSLGDLTPSMCQRNLTRLFRSIRKIGRPVNRVRAENIIDAVKRGYAAE